jgi:hypothetical protein
MRERGNAAVKRLDEGAIPDVDPVLAAFLRAPGREETPEERAAFEAAKAAGGFIDGADVSAEIARRRSEWPGDTGK